MITKQEFVIINRLKNYHDLQNKINELFDDLIDNKENDFCNGGSICIGHESVVVKLLENIFNDKYDNIECWLYELDYGRKYKDGCILDKNGKAIDLSTPDKLYDYLISEMEESNGTNT